MMRKTTASKYFCSLIAFLGLFFVLSDSSPSFATKDNGVLEKGKATGRPVPRFVSLKADKVNVRVGPDSTKYKIKWVYRKAGLPVEIIAEFEHWRHVRDSEGVDGWVFHALLSGRRTALVMPWSKKSNGTGGGQPVPLYKSDTASKGNVALLVESGVLAHVIKCTGNWCKLSISQHEGWIEQKNLWGVYPEETIN